MNIEKKLYQWDTGQKLTRCTGLYVDFPIDNEVYRVETIDGTCIIPDELLQTSGSHKVYECMTNNTIRSFAFSVTPRPKPPDYVYTPTERLTFEGLVQRVDDAVADMIRRAESGEFDGHTPVKGTDYFTTGEIQQIQNEVSSGAIGEFKSVVDTETETFNTNAESKLITYNENDVAKTGAYNTNASDKLDDYNTNASNKVTEYNSNAENKTAEFDTHTEQIQADISELKSDLTNLDGSVTNDIGISLENVFSVETILQNNNTAITNNNDGTYTVGTTDFGLTAFGQITVVKAGTYILYGVEKGHSFLSAKTSTATQLYVNETGKDMEITLEKDMELIIGFQNKSSEKPSSPFVIRPYLNKKTTKFVVIEKQITDLSDRLSKVTNEYITDNVSWELGSWSNSDGANSSSYVIARSTMNFDENKEIVITVSADHQLQYGYFDKSNVWHCDEKWYIGTDLRFVAKEGFIYKFRACGTTQYTIESIKAFSENFIFKHRNEQKNDYCDLAMFDDIAVCGDSYTAGSIFTSANSGTEYNPSSLIGDNAKTRWGTVLGRISGSDITTYASGGANTSTFQSRSECLPKILSDKPHELYVLCLGINDRTYTTKGTIADIKDDYTQNPNTFYGNYGKIISQIKEHAPKAKIIISKVFIVTYQTGAYYQWSSEAIEEIANKFEIPFIDTANDDFFSSDFYNDNMRGGHPIAPTYSAMAKGMKRLLDACISDNVGYFADYYPN